MFNGKIKKLEEELSELKDVIRSINCELGNRSYGTIYVNNSPIRMSEQLEKVIKYLGIEFVWVSGKDGYYKVIKSKKKNRKQK